MMLTSAASLPPLPWMTNEISILLWFKLKRIPASEGTESIGIGTGKNFYGGC